MTLDELFTIEHALIEHEYVAEAIEIIHREIDMKQMIVQLSREEQEKRKHAVSRQSES